MSMSNVSGNRRPVVDCSVSESRTKQSFKDECDINKIVDRYQRTGVLEHTRQAMPQFMDIEPIDFHQAANMMLEAQALFKGIPAALRKEVDNDPGKFLEYCQNPDNRDELIKYGLIDKPAPEPAIQKVEVVNPPDPPAE